MMYKGTADVTIEKAAFEMSIKITSKHENDVLVPCFEIEDIEFSLPDEHLKLSVRGNL